jgi:muconolactone delta-isomerase
MGLTSFLYRLARLSADAKAVSSGNPDRIARRAKNKLLGRALGRAGIWRRLWR